MKNKSSCLYLLLAAIMIVGCSSTDIDALDGSWQAVYCSLGQNCEFYFNFTFTFQTDENKQTIKNEVRILNSIINSYQAYSESYSYSQNQNDTFTLTKTNDKTPFLLKFYNEKMAVAYRKFLTELNSDNYVRYELYAFLKEDAVSVHNYSVLLDSIRADFPGAVFSDTPIQNEQLDFQISKSFKDSQLTGKIWYVQSYWQPKNQSSTSRASTKDFFEQVNTNGAVQGDRCLQSYFTKNWTNEDIGLDSKYNYFQTFFYNESEYYISSEHEVYFPDPVIQSWIHNIDASSGIIYADENNFVELISDKSQALLYTTNPVYSPVTQALFAAQLLKVGINILQGQLFTYNNTACNPNDFSLDQLSGQWELVSSVGFDTADELKGKGCNYLNIGINFDAQQIKTEINGYDFTKQNSFSKTQTYTYKSLSSRSIYIGNQEIILTAINQDSVVFQYAQEEKAFLISRGKAVDFRLINTFALNQFYPGLTKLSPYGSQCTPLTQPLSNLTNEELINNQWYELAMYTEIHLPPKVSCAEWKFSKSSTLENFIDVESIASYEYTSRHYVSTASEEAENPGFYIPLITPAHGFPYNFNRTELFLEVMYYDGTSAILFNRDMADQPYEEDFQFFFISKGLSYTQDDKDKFQLLIKKVLTQFKEFNYFEVNNEGCGYDLREGNGSSKGVFGFLMQN